jgi:hypothetical protein
VNRHHRYRRCHKINTITDVGKSKRLACHLMRSDLAFQRLSVTLDCSLALAFYLKSQNTTTTPINRPPYHDPPDDSIPRGAPVSNLGDVLASETPRPSPGAACPGCTLADCWVGGEARLVKRACARGAWLVSGPLRRTGVAVPSCQIGGQGSAWRMTELVFSLLLKIWEPEPSNDTSSNCVKTRKLRYSVPTVNWSRSEDLIAPRRYLCSSCVALPHSHYLQASR